MSRKAHKIVVILIIALILLIVGVIWRTYFITTPSINTNRTQHDTTQLDGARDRPLVLPELREGE
jgi:flagellar basal body-associated protein FliL